MDVINEYIERFGREVLSGEARYQTEALISLAAWPTVPVEFGSEERDRLRLAVRLAGHDPYPFVNELTRDELGQRILHTWDTHILDATR
jgi:alkylhydroperoxidase family enzyme